jgi:hypothetical protein
MEIFYTEFFPNCSKDIECVGKYPLFASKCELSRNWCSDITVAAHISAKLTLAGQLFVKNLFTTFLENLIDGLVVDTRQVTEKWANIVSKNKVVFLLHKEC